MAQAAQKMPLERAIAIAEAYAAALGGGCESIPTPSEEDVFRLAGLDWVEPWDRV